MTQYVAKPLTSGAKAEGRFGKQDFIYVAEDNTYRCPAGESQPDLAFLLHRNATE
jgi:transposase